MGDAIKKAATTSTPIVERSNFFILNSLLYVISLAEAALAVPTLLARCCCVMK